MYAKSIIDKKLTAVQSLISKRPKDQSYNLTYHTVAEANHYTNHLVELLNPEFLESKLIDPSVKFPMFTRSLFQDEANFIENERILCANDFYYWLSRYVYIESKGLIDELSTVCLFTPNIAQRMLLKIIGDLEERLIAIILQILKARQLGSTSLLIMLMCHRITYHTFEKALIGSSDPDKTAEMSDKMKFAWAHLPPWLKPPMKMSESTKEEIWVDVPSLNNRVIRQHGTQLSGIGRGNTPTIFLLSECPDFSNPEEDIDASLLPAVHDNPRTLGALESTAKGDQGYWPKTWRYNVRNWAKGNSDMCPVFLPAFVGTDLYPTKTWIRKRPIPPDWKPKTNTVAYKTKGEYYISHDKLLSEILGEDYQITKEHLYWYENKYDEAVEKKSLNKLKEEFCSNPEEAFQHSGYSIFTLEQLDEMRARAKPLALYHGKPAVFSLIGTDINSDHEPDLREIDTSRPPIEIISDLMYGENKATYRLLPLIFDPAMIDVFSEDFNNRIFIWEFPFTATGDKGEQIGKRSNTQEYGLGNDNGEGIGQNKTAIEIIRKGSIYEYSEQVCEFATRWISANELIPWMDALGQFYSHYSDDITNECKIIIEVACGGSGLQHRLRVDRGWFNFHRWEGALDSPKRRSLAQAKLGWETNRWTRPWIVGDVTRDIKDGYLRINSPFLIRECQTLQKEDDNSKIEAVGQDTDDNFFASGMAHFSLSIWDIRKRIEGKYGGLGGPTLNDTITRDISLERTKVIGKVDEYLWPKMG